MVDNDSLSFLLFFWEFSHGEVASQEMSTWGLVLQGKFLKGNCWYGKSPIGGKPIQGNFIYGENPLGDKSVQENIYYGNDQTHLAGLSVVMARSQSCIHIMPINWKQGEKLFTPNGWIDLVGLSRNNIAIKVAGRTQIMGHWNENHHVWETTLCVWPQILYGYLMLRLTMQRAQSRYRCSHYCGILVLEFR